MVQTINGIIARDDYEEDFISEDNWTTLKKLVEEAGGFIIGRKTYEIVKKWKDLSFDNFKAIKIIVSKNKNIKYNKQYILAGSPEEALRVAKASGLSKILLIGGSTLNTSFIKKKLVDKIIINIEPYVLGKGIRIFSEENFESKLKLLMMKKLKSGIIQLHYKIIRHNACV